MGVDRLAFAACRPLKHPELPGRTPLHLPVTDIFGVRRRARLANAPLDPPFRARVNSLCRLMDEFDFEIDTVTLADPARVGNDPGHLAIQAVPGIGPILATVMIAEIGDVHRFPTSRH